MPQTNTRIKLTKKQIDRVPYPREGQIMLRDSELPGFALRVTHGSKSFIVEKRVQRRHWKVTIGTYGPFTVDQARERAREVMGKLLRGEDLNQDRRQLSFGELADLVLRTGETT